METLKRLNVEVRRRGGGEERGGGEKGEVERGGGEVKCLTEGHESRSSELFAVTFQTVKVTRGRGR